MLYGEIVAPTRLLFQYMKASSNSDKLRDFIAPKMTNLINFLDNNLKYTVYIVWDIHGIYCYLDIIGSPTTLTTLGQRSHHFSPSSSIKNDAETIQLVIAAIRSRQKSICEWCGRIGHKADDWIICGAKSLPKILRRRMNRLMQFMVINQMNHQDNIKSNLRHITSNTGPLLPKPTLWFQISWGDLIIMP